MSRTCTVVFALAAAALVAAGCGHSTSSSRSTQAMHTSPASATPSASTTVARTDPLTRTELVAKADAVCRRIASKRNRITFQTSTQLELTLPKIATYQRALLAGLSRLTPPASMASQWRQIVAASQTLATSTTELSRGTQSSTGKGPSPLFATFAHARLQMQAVARREGIKDCATY